MPYPCCTKFTEMTKLPPCFQGQWLVELKKGQKWKGAPIIPKAVTTRNCCVVVLGKGLRVWAFQETCNQNNVKLVGLEERVHSGEQSLAQLCQAHEITLSQIKDVDSCVFAWKTKYVNFYYLKKVTIESLNINVYNPEGKDWENFQRKWKQSTNFFIPKEPEIEEDLEDSIDLEEFLKKHPQTKEAPANPTDQLVEEGN
ncbi:hypothetical protein PVK06_011270 [Gossypium arboreum]|uniref:Uncharacterized protein n=1 Tax=Gossypium arboreum TaxID=29729 RepID=A0ABR0Q9A7_GOSAR|nr:hypothetical protein PVK06_011270 [Gossypium arboreum]